MVRGEQGFVLHFWVTGVCEEGERAGRVSVSEGSLCVFVKDTER